MRWSCCDRRDIVIGLNMAVELSEKRLFRDGFRDRTCRALWQVILRLSIGTSTSPGRMSSRYFGQSLEGGLLLLNERR